VPHVFFTPSEDEAAWAREPTETAEALLVAEGWLITAEQLGAMSPYLRAHISRFGARATDDLRRHPEAFDPVLKEVDFTAPALAA
jgi:hypothetical protein